MPLAFCTSGLDLGPHTWGCDPDLATRRAAAGGLPQIRDTSGHAGYVRLFTTLVRFDPVYHGHFKCNLRRIVDYPALWRFTCELMAMPEIGATVNMRHIKHHYYESHPSINPSGIVPLGPRLVYGSTPTSV